MTREDAERTAPLPANCREDAGNDPGLSYSASSTGSQTEGKAAPQLNDRSCPCRIPMRMRMPAPTTDKPRIPSI